eukprot:5682670-Prymnesium_polylepis.2
MCMLHPPFALGACTRASARASCFGSVASASSPAACHTPSSGRTPPSSLRTCSASPASHRSVVASTPVACTACHSVAVLRASAPPRDTRINRRAPRCDNQRPVSKPSPPVPPDTT